MNWTIREGNAIDVLRKLPASSIDCVVTSPPYWSLREYLVPATIWDGDPKCKHRWVSYRQPAANGSYEGMHGWTKQDKSATRIPRTQTLCAKCQAWRGQLGLEPTPKLYVQHIVQVFREIRRVLKPGAALWINLGDTWYSAAGNGRTMGGSSFDHYRRAQQKATGGYPKMPPNRLPIDGLKGKDLVGIPWAVATALREPYYAGQMKNERDRVWMAATMDAEGSICGSRHRRKDTGAIRTTLSVMITNTAMEMLNEASRIWPAHLSQHDKHFEGDGHLGKLDCFRWIVHGVENKLLFLREIFPYLVVKRRQAIIAYNFLLLMKDAKRMGKIPQGAKAHQTREQLVRLLSDLNQRRDVELPEWLIEPPSVAEQGLWLRSEIIWHKPNGIAKVADDRPAGIHETIFLMANAKKYYYDFKATQEPRSEHERTRRLREREQGRKGVEFAIKRDGDANPPGRTSMLRSLDKRIELAVEGTRRRRSVWEIAVTPYSGEHSSMFPLRIAEVCIAAGCPEGGTVLDPFCGMATVGVMALRMGRKFVGIDAAGKTCIAARERIVADQPMFNSQKIPTAQIEDSQASLFA